MRFRTAHVIGAFAIAAAVAAGNYRSSVHAPHFGEDFEIICAAGEVLGQGGSPYHLPTLEGVSGLRGTFLGYPPLTAVALRPICGQVVPIWVVLAGVALLLAVTSRLPGVGVQPAAWVLAGFVRWPARQASVAAATAAAVFVTLHLVTFAVTPVAFGQYWNAVATGWDGLVQAELRFGSENNPSVFAFLPIAMDHLGAGAGAGYALAALAAMAFAVLWYWRWRAARRSEDARVWLALLAMGVMALAYPRFKPYTMVFLLPAMAMILARLQGAQLNIGLVVACLLPNVALIGMTWLSTGPPMPVPVVFALQYAQWVLIACALALALTPSVMRQLTKPSTG